MERNLDLLRNIMLSLEKNIDPNKQLISTEGLKTLESDVGILNEHIKLLVENDLIETMRPMNVDDGPIKRYTHIKRITSRGYDFLDALRNEDIWNKTKETAISAGGFTLSLIIELGKDYLKKKLALS